MAIFFRANIINFSWKWGMWKCIFIYFVREGRENFYYFAYMPNHFQLIDAKIFCLFLILHCIELDFKGLKPFCVIFYHILGCTVILINITYIFKFSTYNIFIWNYTLKKMLQYLWFILPQSLFSFHFILFTHKSLSVSSSNFHEIFPSSIKMFIYILKNNLFTNFFPFYKKIDDSFFRWSINLQTTELFFLLDVKNMSLKVFSEIPHSPVT